MHIYFDLDDTLIQTQELYNNVKDKAAEYISDISKVESAEVLRLFEAIDLENVKKMGLSKERFPISWKKTAHELVDNISIFGLKEINKITKKVFEDVSPLYDDSIRVLKELRNMGHSLYLLTSGELEVQEKRINDVQLNGFFDHVYIVPMKNEVVMKSIMEDHLEDTVMVGNSLKSDILPALNIGINAIHIVRNTWGFDKAEVNKESAEYIESLLSSVPKNIFKLRVARDFIVKSY